MNTWVAVAPRSAGCCEPEASGDHRRQKPITLASTEPPNRSLGAGVCRRFVAGADAARSVASVASFGQ